jgi:hypothetical protein
MGVHGQDKPNAASSSSSTAKGVFTNPLLSSGADPWSIWDGFIIT